MWRALFVTPLGQATFADLLLFLAVLMILSLVIEFCGWVYRSIAGRDRG